MSDEAGRPGYVKGSATVPGGAADAPSDEGSAAEAAGPKRKRRHYTLEALVVFLALFAAGAATLLTNRTQELTAAPAAVLSVSSDPEGAAVIIDDIWVGTTPVSVNLEQGSEIELRLEAAEPFSEYDLYKLYRSTLVVDRDRDLSVWITRTTAEEQEQQRAARGY